MIIHDRTLAPFLIGMDSSSLTAASWMLASLLWVGIEGSQGKNIQFLLQLLTPTNFQPLNPL